MKSLLLIDKLEQGGAERQFVYLACMLKRRGVNVRVVQFYEGGEFYRDELKDAEIKIETLSEGQPKFKRAFIIKNLIKNWLPDAVICFKPGTCMAGCIARRLIKFNLIVSERNTTQTLSKSERLKFFLYRWADHIVCNSFSQGKYIQDNYPNLSSKISIITNMLDTNKFKPILRNRPTDKLSVLTTARVTPQKNVLRFLDAVKIIAEKGIKVHFNWYGRIDDKGDYWGNIENKIKELKLSGIISFKGAVKNILSVYNENDIFILPSNYEGFPNSLCEAMACELPSIASNVCDSPLILQNKEWLVDPENPIDIANKIERMVSLRLEQRVLIGASNRKRIEELCSPESFVEKYIEVISHD